MELWCNSTRNARFAQNPSALARSTLSLGNVPIRFITAAFNLGFRNNFVKRHSRLPSDVGWPASAEASTGYRIPADVKLKCPSCGGDINYSSMLADELDEWLVNEEARDQNVCIGFKL
jgi:hypothetical protein